VLPSGVRTWYLRFRDSSGRQRFHKLARADRMNRTVARDQALQLLASVARGTDQVAAPGATMAQLLELLETRHYAKLRPSTAKNYRGFWRLYVLPAMAGRKVASVTRQDVLQLLAPMAPVQANRTLQMLKAAFNHAELWGLRPEHSNPCRRIPKHTEQPRRRYLSQQETAQLLAACDQLQATPVQWRFTQLVRLLLFTGARLNEIKAARWEWFNPAAATLVIPPEQHKTGGDGHARVIHLSAPAMTVLLELQAQAQTPWVIAGQGDGPLVGYHKLWGRLLAAAGLQQLRIHDLRHSYASMAVSAGLSLPQIGGLLGHASPVTTARYAHLISDQAAEMAAKVTAQIRGR
jgi:integrase